MAKFHINPDTGKAGECRAKTPDSCTYSQQEGTVVEHYDTKEAAQAAYEKKMNKTIQATVRKARAKNNSQKPSELDKDKIYALYDDISDQMDIALDMNDNDAYNAIKAIRDNYITDNDTFDNVAERIHNSNADYLDYVSAAVEAVDEDYDGLRDYQIIPERDKARQLSHDYAENEVMYIQTGDQSYLQKTNMLKKKIHETFKDAPSLRTSDELLRYISDNDGVVDDKLIELAKEARNNDNMIDHLEDLKGDRIGYHPFWE